MRHQYGMFGAVTPSAGQLVPTWSGVPARPIYGSNPGAQARAMAGLGGGTLTINGTTVPVDTGALFSGLGSLLVSRAVYAALGYYIGGKLGPASSASKIAGAAACALAGPLGLAGVAAYYGGKR